MPSAGAWADIVDVWIFGLDDFGEWRATTDDDEHYVYAVAL
jgi:hypothetical protein